MTTNTLRKSIYLKASRDEVWSFLTDPDKLAIWFHKPPSPLTEGEDYAMFGVQSGDKLMWGRVASARRPEYLEYTFTIAPMGEASSVVKWTLDEVAGGTRLSLEHDGLPAAAEAFGLTLALDKGWDDHIARMRAALHGDGDG